MRETGLSSIAKMKSINVFYTLVAFLDATGIALAVPTWPSPATDELEDIMFLLSGYDRRVGEPIDLIDSTNIPRALPTL
jgi:hypothetical protein